MKKRITFTAEVVVHVDIDEEEFEETYGGDGNYLAEDMDYAFDLAMAEAVSTEWLATKGVRVEDIEE